MRTQESRFLALISAVILLASVCHSATITGTVKGVDGAPFQGAFVEAQNVKMKMTVNVLSDSQGRYRGGGTSGRGISDNDQGGRLYSDAPHRRKPYCQPKCLLRLCPGKGDGSLERPFPISGPKIVARGKRERPDRRTLLYLSRI